MTICSFLFFDGISHFVAGGSQRFKYNCCIVWEFKKKDKKTHSGLMWKSELYIYMFITLQCVQSVEFCFVVGRGGQGFI